MKAELKMYMCSNCDALYDTADEALECCQCWGCAEKDKRIEELEARDVVTPEYLQSWVDRANTAEAQLESVRGLERYSAVSFNVTTQIAQMVSDPDGEVVRYADLQQALENDK